MIHPGTMLRRDIENGHPVSPFIGIYDAFSATIAAKHSPNLFYSGFGFAASHYGLPDFGYIAWSDIVQAAWRIRLPYIKLLVDIDDGYADTAVACHVTRQLEAMGVAMIMLEDQARPRRCGHHDGKLILPLEQYIEKLSEVLRCRSHICVLARTDAFGEEIFRRIKALSQTDADVLLIDGIRSIQTLREVRKITNKPILFNQIAGGKSPRVSLDDLRKAGASLTLYSTPCLFAAQAAIDDALTQIFAQDGMLPDANQARSVGVDQSTSILESNVEWQARAVA
jgi:2-methylisocitrate lyase-like PEP mutase family enzyme